MIASRIAKFAFSGLIAALTFIASQHAQAGVCYVYVNSCTAGVTPQVWFVDWEYSSTQSAAACDQRAADFHHACQANMAYSVYQDEQGQRPATPNATTCWIYNSGTGTAENFSDYKVEQCFDRAYSSARASQAIVRADFYVLDRSGADWRLSQRSEFHPESRGTTPLLVQDGLGLFGEFEIFADQRLTVGPMSFVLQRDGNLVLYHGGLGNIPVWWSASGGRDCANCRAVFQNDGNLVVYQGQSPIWTSDTPVAGIDQLQITEHFPYVMIHSNKIDRWAVLPNGNLRTPDNVVLEQVQSFR